MAKQNKPIDVKKRFMFVVSKRQISPDKIQKTTVALARLDLRAVLYPWVSYVNLLVVNVFSAGVLSGDF